MTRIYLAGPLFTYAEQAFNRSFAVALRQACGDVEIILPQDRAKHFMMLEDGLGRVFQDCLAMIRASDVVVAILDGADVDSGTAVEMGFAYSLGKRIIGIRTDSRASEDRGMNLMVSHVCTSLVLGSVDRVEDLALTSRDAIVAAGSAEVKFTNR